MSQMRSNQPNSNQSNGNHPTSSSLQQSNAEQKIWIKEQEVSALKVQNRHLLAKLEDAEKSAKPNQVNTQFIAIEVQKSLQPVLQQLEKSIQGAFEILQSTMRGVYQQSQRCQQAVEEMGAHTRDIEVRIHEQRKADHVFFQEKILTSVTAFTDRMERQIENRLKALSGIELMNNKQNEMLNDVDQMKSMINGMHKASDLNRSDLSRIERESIETSQKVIEVQVQTQNAEELSRDVLQQIQNHRAEFKLLRGELRSILETNQKLSEKLNQIESQVTQHHEKRIEQELKELETADSIQDLIDVKESDIENIQTVLNAADASQNKEDLTLILEMLRSQKADLKRVAKEAELRLRASQNPSASATSQISPASANNANSTANSILAANNETQTDGSFEVQSVDINGPNSDENRFS
jgi:hypothetical protein